MTNPFFSFKHFTIRQEDAPLKVTTDSCMLGAYASAISPTHILDIGTGTGILAIMAAQRFREAYIDGIEADMVAAEQARKNAQTCPWTSRIKIKTVRIQDYLKKQRKIYDLILCNPPYHESQFPSRDNRKNLAKHSIGMSLPELAHAVDQLISSVGNFYSITPPESFGILDKELSFYGFRTFDRLLIYNLPSKPLYRIIGGFSKVKKREKENELQIMDKEGNYTIGFRKLLTDFYLAF